MSADPPGHHSRDADRLIYAGLLGLGAAAVIQLIDKGELDLAQHVAVYAFGVAIPFLAVGLLAYYARQAGTRIPPVYDLVGLLGALGSVGGFGSMFFHFGVGPGIAFTASVVIGVVLIRWLE